MNKYENHFDVMQIGFHTVQIHHIPETEHAEQEDWNWKRLEKEEILILRHLMGK